MRRVDGIVHFNVQIHCVAWAVDDSRSDRAIVELQMRDAHTHGKACEKRVLRELLYIQSIERKIASVGIRTKLKRVEMVFRSLMRKSER